MYSAVDKNMTNTPKRVSYVRGYGRIESLNTKNLNKNFYTFGRLQPLCGNFGNHLPEKTNMENSQHRLAWANNTQPANCSYQNQLLNSLKQTNSQISDGTDNKNNNTTTARMQPAPYSTNDASFHCK